MVERVRQKRAGEACLTRPQSKKNLGGSETYLSRSLLSLKGCNGSRLSIFSGRSSNGWGERRRMGGDEFIVLLPDQLCDEDAVPVAERLMVSITGPNCLVRWRSSTNFRCLSCIALGMSIRAQGLPSEQRQDIGCDRYIFCFHTFSTEYLNLRYRYLLLRNSSVNA